MQLISKDGLLIYQNLGEDPLKIVKALAMNDINSTELKQNDIATNGFCPSCNMPMEADLDFCANCGDYQN